MRINRQDAGWSQVREVWYKGIEVSEITVAVDDEEGWVDVQCSAEAKVTRFEGSVEIVFEEEGSRSRSDSERGSG